MPGIYTFTADSAARGWDFSAGRKVTEQGDVRAAHQKNSQSCVGPCRGVTTASRDLLPPLELVPAPWVSPLFADTTGHLLGVSFVPCVRARGGTALCQVVVLRGVLVAGRCWCWVHLAGCGKFARTADTEGI